MPHLKLRKAHRVQDEGLLRGRELLQRVWFGDGVETHARGGAGRVKQDVRHERKRGGERVRVQKASVHRLGACGAALP